MVVIGGGVSGLAIGYFARREGIPFTILEGQDRLGGACVTFRRGGFSFDSGAHRFHDKDPQTTQDAMALLGDDLLRVEAPSLIYDGGRFIRFPFNLPNLVRHLGPRAVAVGGLELLGARISRRRVTNFADAAVRRYGKTVARRFLLNYTEKLWGAPCDRLVPELSGGRLRGLDLREMLRDTLRAVRNPLHMEGEFYYPRLGIGMLTDALAAAVGDGGILIGTPVTRVLHNGSRVLGAMVGNGTTVSAEQIVSTIPLDRLVGILDPPLDGAVCAAARELRYRHLVLVAFFLDVASVTSAATVYFPAEAFPFTRVVEPRNRSAAMSPHGQTSLVAEIPCDEGSEPWSAADKELIATTQRCLEEIGWLTPNAILGATVERLRHAYPVGSLPARDAVGTITRALGEIRGLHLLGRNGTFRYAWIHDLMHDARALVQGISRGR
ncbi:MAG: FAD-dependent oxidoreductase [Candidatus Eisenbacteria bacterium]|jgi:protoporphyrinogen oxidase|nr:FAD-dependent oxidoreductase [Candidatus Eisenbacteria bacterium]